VQNPVAAASPSGGEGHPYALPTVSHQKLARAGDEIRAFQGISVLIRSILHKPTDGTVIASALREAIS
jgi:hypothetical protein